MIDMDTPSASRMSLLYPNFMHKLLDVYEFMFDTYKLQMRCTEGLRTYAEQNAYYAQGRTIPGKIITNAQGGFSFHNFGVAADSCFLGNDPFLDQNPKKNFLWQEFGSRCKQEGLGWGGDFKINAGPEGMILLGDFGHCECGYGLNLSEMRAIYADSGLAGVWAQLDLERQSAPTRVH